MTLHEAVNINHPKNKKNCLYSTSGLLDYKLLITLVLELRFLKQTLLHSIQIKVEPKTFGIIVKTLIITA